MERQTYKVLPSIPSSRYAKLLKVPRMYSVFQLSARLPIPQNILNALFYLNNFYSNFNTKAVSLPESPSWYLSLSAYIWALIPHCTHHHHSSQCTVFKISIFLIVSRLSAETISFRCITSGPRTVPGVKYGLIKCYLIVIEKLKEKMFLNANWTNP